MKFKIRPYGPGDAPALARLYYDSVRGLGERRYTPEQVRAWAPAPVDVGIVEARASDGRIILVAVGEQGRLLAYGDLEDDGHIDHLYCHPDAAGRGVASAVLAALLKHATVKGLDHLYVEASEIARSLFERYGFTVSHRRDFEVRGVAIHNYAMDYRRRENSPT